MSTSSRNDVSAAAAIATASSSVRRRSSSRTSASQPSERHRASGSCGSERVVATSRNVSPTRSTSSARPSSVVAVELPAAGRRARARSGPSTSASPATSAERNRRSLAPRSHSSAVGSVSTPGATAPSGDEQVGPERRRVLVEQVERQPGDRHVERVDPLPHERRLAEPGHRRDERDAVLGRQRLQHAVACDERVGQGRRDQLRPHQVPRLAVTRHPARWYLSPPLGALRRPAGDGDAQPRASWAASHSSTSRLARRATAVPGARPSKPCGCAGVDVEVDRHAGLAEAHGVVDVLVGEAVDRADGDQRRGQAG